MSNRSILALLVLATSGCAWLHPVDHEVAPPVITPERFVSGTATSSVAKGKWWVAFGDPELDRLQEDAFRHNLDLLRAFHRLDRAAAVAGIADSAYWPSLNVEAGLSRSRSANIFPRGAAGEPELFANELTIGTLSVGAAYEVDLFGKVASQGKAADFEVMASRHDLDAVAMSLSANVAELWFQLVAQRTTLDLIDRQVERNQTFLDLTEARFSQGQSNALDVLQQRQQVAGNRAQRPLVEARIAVLENQLNVLLGRPPHTEQFSDVRRLPNPPPVPAVGLPADLIRRRPDVRAAEKRAVAADYRVGVAIADRFPSLRLNGSLGLRIFSLASFFDAIVYSVAGSVLAPIFDGGRRSAEVDRTKAVLADILTAYGQTVLGAFREVEDALVQERKQREHLVELERQLDASAKTLDEARTRYLSGLSEYLPVLTALGQKQVLELALVNQQRQLLSYRIQLCRSLGGNWMNTLDRPTFAKVDREKEVRDRR